MKRFKSVKNLVVVMRLRKRTFSVNKTHKHPPVVALLQISQFSAPCLRCAGTLLASVGFGRVWSSGKEKVAFSTFNVAGAKQVEVELS